MIARLTAYLPAPLRALFRLEPVNFTWWEMLCFRLGIAYLILTSVPHMGLGSVSCPTFDSLPVPSSLGVWCTSITQLSDITVFNHVRHGFWLALALYVCGLAMPVALTYLIIVDACLGSLIASQGAHGHSRQVLALLMLGLAMGAWWGVFKKEHGGARNLWRWTLPGERHLVNWGQQMVAAAYAVSAVTKECNSEGLWFMHSENFILAVAKAQEEAVIKGTVITPAATAFADWMGQQPFLSSCMLLGAWLLEMGAPLMLLNRRMALIIAVLLWIFHAINGWFMGLPFDLNRSIVVVLFMNLPFWFVWLGAKVLRRPGIVS